MILAERLKNLREGLQMTQQEIADLLGISKSAYIKYERGEREPRLSQLDNISNILGVSTGYLIGVVDDPEPTRGINLGNAAIRTILEDPFFFDRFGENGQAIKNVAYSYISHVMLAYHGNIDLLYMELLLIEKFESMYNIGEVAFLAPDKLDVGSYQVLREATSDFDSVVHEFSDLVHDPDFFHKEEYFMENIKSYEPPTLTDI